MGSASHYRFITTEGVELCLPVHFIDEGEIWGSKEDGVMYISFNGTTFSVLGDAEKFCDDQISHFDMRVEKKKAPKKEPLNNVVALTDNRKSSN